MSEVSVRELRNEGGRVLDRVARGERITVTRDGKPVAELRPYVGVRFSAETLLARWSQLPPIDPVAFRRDIDAVLDTQL